MKILGIGNAIVDVLCKVTDEFLQKNELTKSTMKLIDEQEFKKLLSSLKIEKTISGGSVANSIVGLSQLENNVAFIGKINDDELGHKYELGLKEEKVKYLYKKKQEPIPTGSCLILITPDSERTMCTFLGTAGKINDNDVNEQEVKNADITFLEGYLWDEGEPKKATSLPNCDKPTIELAIDPPEIVSSIFNEDSRFLNSRSSTSFIVLLVNEFSSKNSSVTLQRTSTIAFPIPNIFMMVS